MLLVYSSLSSKRLLCRGMCSAGYVGVKYCYYEVCRVQCWALWYSHTVSNSVGWFTIGDYLCVTLSNDLQTELARRCVAHPLGCSATQSLYFPTSSGRLPVGQGQQHNKSRQKALGPTAPPAIVLSGYEPISLATAPKWEMEAAGSVQVVEKELAKKRLKLASATAAAVTVEAALQAAETKSKTKKKRRTPVVPALDVDGADVYSPFERPHDRVSPAGDLRRFTFPLRIAPPCPSPLGRPEAIFGFAAVVASLARAAASRAVRGAMSLPARVGGS
jgi:hypothetical protein